MRDIHEVLLNNTRSDISLNYYRLPQGEIKHFYIGGEMFHVMPKHSIPRKAEVRFHMNFYFLYNSVFFHGFIESSHFMLRALLCFDSVLHQAHF